MKMREKGKLGKQKKNLRMNKSKENILKCMRIYIYTHPRTFKCIYKYRYTYSASQIVLFDIIFESV